MADNEEFESSESKEESEEEESGESSEQSSDEAEFANDDDVRDSQNEIRSQRQGPRSNLKYPD